MLSLLSMLTRQILGGKQHIRQIHGFAVLSKNLVDITVIEYESRYKLPGTV